MYMHFHMKDRMHKYYFLLFSGASFTDRAISKPERTASSSGSIVYANTGNDCESLEPDESPTLHNHYRKFTQIQKATVKDYAKNHGIRAAAKHFSVPKSTVGNWIKVNLRNCNMRNPKADHLSEISKATFGSSTFINERIHSSNEKKTGPDNESQKMTSHSIIGSAASVNETMTVSEKANSFSINPDSEIVTSIFNSETPNESANSLVDKVNNSSCTNLEPESICCIPASQNERINSEIERADSNCENLDSEIGEPICGNAASADFHCEQADCDCKQLESVVSKHLLIFKESQKKAVEEYAKIHGIRAATKHFNITASGVIRRKTDLNDNLRNPKKGHLIKEENIDLDIDSGNAASSSKCSSSVCDKVESDCKSVKSRTAPTRLGHYRNFTLNQKIAVKDYAKIHGIRAAAKHYGVPKSSVHNWNKTDFSDDNARNCKTGHLPKPGCPLSYDRALDLKILAHVQEQQDCQIPITRKDICSYARKVVKPVTPGFKASLGWFSLFIKRHNLCLGKKDLECSGASFSSMDTKPANGPPVKHSVKKGYAKRKRLTRMQKLLVKQYAQAHGIEQAAKHFKVSKEMVKIWNRTDFSNKRRSCNLPRPGHPCKEKGNRSCDTQAATDERIITESESTNTNEKLECVIVEDTHLSDSVAASHEKTKFESESTNIDEKLECVIAEDTCTHLRDSVAATYESIKSEIESTNTNEKLESVIAKETNFSDSTNTWKKLEFRIDEATLGNSTLDNEKINSLSETTGSDSINQKQKISNILGNATSTNEITTSVNDLSYPPRKKLEHDIATTVFDSAASLEESASSVNEKVNPSYKNLESDSISCCAASCVASPNERMNSAPQNTNSNCENLESKITPTRLGRYKKFTKMQKLTVIEYAKIHGIKAAAKHFGVPFSTVSLWNKTDFSNDNSKKSKKGHVERRGRPLKYDAGLDFIILAHVLEQQHRQIPITRKDLCSYARKIVTPVHPEFGATKQWASAFIKRHNLSLSPDVAPTNHEHYQNFTKRPHLIVLTPRGHYKNFTLSQKLAVKDYAKKHGIRAAAKHYGVPKSNVHTWNKTDFSDDNARNCKTGHLPKPGCPLSYDRALDLKILAHVQEQQDCQIPITKKDICSYARKVVKPVTPGFKASLGWFSLFIKRHNLCLDKKDLECSGASFSNMDTKPANGPPVRHSVKKGYAKRKKLTLMQKLLVKQYAQEHGIEQAAKHFKVSKEMVKIWNRKDFCNKRRSCKTGNLPRPGRPCKEKVNRSCDTQAATDERIKTESECTNTNEKLEYVIAEDTHLSDSVSASHEKTKFESESTNIDEKLECVIAEDTCTHLRDSVAATYESIKSESESTNTNEKLESVKAKETKFSDSTNTWEKLEFRIDEATQGNSTLDNEKINSLSETTGSDPINQKQKISNILGNATSTNEITTSVNDLSYPPRKKLEHDIATTVFDSAASLEESASSVNEKVNPSYKNLESDSISCCAASCVASPNERMNSAPQNTNSNCENLESKITPTRLGRYKKFTKMQKLTVIEYAKIHGIKAAAKHFGVPFSTVSLWNKTDFSNDNSKKSKKGHVERRGRPLKYDAGLDFIILAHVLEQQHRQIPITRKDLCSYARKIVTPVHPEFGATKQWASAFIKRHNLSLSPDVAPTNHEHYQNFTKRPHLIVLTPRGHYKNFTLSQKLAVKDYAKKHGIRAAAKHYGVPKSNVHTWNKTDFSDDNARNCKTGHLPKPGCPLSYDRALDLKILAHVQEQQDCQIPITKKDICSYARKVVKPVTPGFKASLGWFSLFIKRHNLCLGKKDLECSGASFSNMDTKPANGPPVRHSVKKGYAKRKKLTLMQKLLVKQYAQEHGIEQAAKHFKVSKEMVKIWNRKDFCNKRRSCKTGNLPRPGRPCKEKVNRSCDTQAATDERIKTESECTNTNEKLEYVIAEDTHLSDSVSASHEKTKFESESTNIDEKLECVIAEDACTHLRDSVAATDESIKSESESTNTNEKLESVKAKETKFSDSTNTWEKLEFRIDEATQGNSTLDNEKINSLSETTGSDSINQKQKISNILGNATTTNEITTSVNDLSYPSRKKLEHEIATTVFDSAASLEESASSVNEKANPSYKNLESDSISCCAASCVASPNEKMNSVPENTNSNCENLESKITPTRLGRYKKFTKMQKLTVIEYAKIHGIKAAAKHFGVPFSTVSLWNKTDFSIDNFRNSKKGHGERKCRPKKYDAGLDFIILAHVLEQQDRQIPITRKDLCSYARKIVTPVYPEFGATKQWASAFIKRHNLSLSPDVAPTNHEHYPNFTKRRHLIVSTPRGHYKNFTLSQKLAVKDYAKKHGIRAAAKHYGVPKSNVHTWNKTDFSDDNARNYKNGHLPKSGRLLTYDEGLDFVILAHVLEQLDRQIPVTRKDLCLYARKIVTPVSPGFRASYCWAERFEKRHNLSLHKRRYMAKE